MRSGEIVSLNVTNLDLILDELSCSTSFQTHALPHAWLRHEVRARLARGGRSMEWLHWPSQVIWGSIAPFVRPLSDYV